MLDELFHEKIIAYTKNPLLININRQLTEQYRIYRGDSVTGPAQFYNALEGHEAILKAMLDRDRIAAARAMQKHLDSIVNDLPASKRISDETRMNR
ncbi:MAG: FCD domain-containing protein [Clostridia bacterium]